MIVEIGRLDPATQDAWGTWEITAGQGTGDLAELSGTLSSDTRISDATTGKIRCRRAFAGSRRRIAAASPLTSA